MKKVISTQKAPKAIGPYSQAILSGNTLYCSGQISINPKTGELIFVPEKKKIYFKMSKHLKEEINK